MARLKSSSIGCPSTVSRIFDGLRSPCVTPRACAWSRASANRAPSQAMARAYDEAPMSSRARAPEARAGVLGGRDAVQGPQQVAARSPPARRAQDLPQGRPAEEGHAEQVEAVHAGRPCAS